MTDTLHPSATHLPFERAKARVEAGDFSFDAMAALTVAHSEKLVRDYDAAVTLVHLMGSDGSAYCGAIRGDRTKNRTVANCPICWSVSESFR